MENFPSINCEFGVAVVAAAIITGLSGDRKRCGAVHWLVTEFPGRQSPGLSRGTPHTFPCYTHNSRLTTNNQTDCVFLVAQQLYMSSCFFVCLFVCPIQIMDIQDLLNFNQTKPYTTKPN